MGIRGALDVINRMVSDRVIEQYAIGGAVAAFNYIEVSSTDDLDILTSFEDFAASSGLVTLTPILSYLAARGYTEFNQEGIVIEGWPVQFLPVASDLDKEALEAAETVEVKLTPASEPITTRVLRPEHVVANALKIGRTKDRLRVAQFVEEGAVDYNALCDVLQRHQLDAAWRDFCTVAGIADPCTAGGSRE